MDQQKYQALRTKFLMSYADLPFSVRKEVVVCLGNEPVTWRLAFLEIKNETEKGKEILDILDKLKILNINDQKEDKKE